METDKMSTASSVGTVERRPLMQALVIERRTLFACTVLVGLCCFVWLAAVCTEKWVHIEGGIDIGNLPVKGRYLIYSDSGVWEICRYVFQQNLTSLVPDKNATGTMPPRQDTVEMTGQFLTNRSRSPAHLLALLVLQAGMEYDTDEVAERTNYLSQPLMENGKPVDPAYEINIANYVRTMISFGIISLFVMAMGCGFSIYTFRNPRYMFKRLAAGIHFISTSCTFVVVQVMMTTVDHMKKNVKFIYPEKASHSYHISFYMAWFVVLVNLYASASFLWYSRKRKGDKAATDELAMADEPTIIGR